MPVEHGTLEAFGVIFGCWAVVFFGIWTMPIDLVYHIGIDIFSSIAFIIFGLVYFSYKEVIHVRWDRFLLWLVVISLAIMAGVNFILTLTTWKSVTINDVLVVTYGNIISLMFTIAGILEIWLALKLVSMYIRSHKVKKKERIKTTRK
jgi:hypothetical protein